MTTRPWTADLLLLEEILYRSAPLANTPLYAAAAKTGLGAKVREAEALNAAGRERLGRIVAALKTAGLYDGDPTFDS